MDELTQREKQAAKLAACGLSNKEVGYKMSIEESTVKQYLHRAYDKLGVSSRGELQSLGGEPLK